MLNNLTLQDNITLTMKIGAIPPPLAPTVEEAYRRKCIQLKQRINEVDHDNESARIRVVRLERGVQKLRLERAFLLEQLAKRTSTNVEDSEGSPSPPPTVSKSPFFFYFFTSHIGMLLTPLNSA